MKIHRFFLNTGFCEGEMKISDVELVHQARAVLKLQPEETCVFFNATGQEATATIVEYAPAYMVVRVTKITQKDEDAQKVILYCAVLKRENFEWVVQKATELGVSEIIPIITARTIKMGLKQSRLEKIATEASEQSGRVRVPIIHESMTYTEALDRAQDHERTIVLHTQNEQDGEIEKKTYKTIGLFIGPEGGFTDEEIQQARAYKYHIYTFPNMILRAETAAIVGVFWAKNSN
jgi:16S rRNA (uracil1498-N3)-methyltransferase